MSSIIWNHCIGQQRVKEALESAVANNSLGHAYLFCGEPGVGTFAAALDLASNLLCSGEGDRPCGTCNGCRKVASNSHPDLHIVMPLCFEKEHKSDNKLTDAGWAFVADQVRFAIAAPYEGSQIDGVAAFAVDWIKEVNHSILRGMVEAKRSVVIIIGTEQMAKEAANALLKTLEEPPAGALLILCTDRRQAVLPTIASRCQQFKFGVLTDDQVRAGMQRYRETGTVAQHGDSAVIHAAGSLSAALDLLDNPQEEVLAEVETLWQLCAAGDWLGLAPRVDELSSKADQGACERLVRSVMFFAQMRFLRGKGAQQNYFCDGSTFDPTRADQCRALCDQTLGALKAHGNQALVMVHFFMHIMEIINVKG